MKDNKANVNPSQLITNFSLFCDKVYEEVNRARTNPKEYAKFLKEIIETMPNEKTIAINEYQMVLNEGRPVIEEAITFLLTQGALQDLDYNQYITQSAEELLNFLILHDGMNMNELNNPNYDLEKRLGHYGEAFGELTELIDYGTFDPRYVIANFILSDGDPHRGERNTLFNPLISTVGIAAGLLPSDRICTVLNFAQYFFGPGQIVLANFGNKIVMAKLNQTMPVPMVVRRHSSELFKEKRKMYMSTNVNQSEVIKTEGMSRSEMKSQMKKETGMEKIDSDEEDDGDAIGLPEGVKEIKTQEKIMKDKDGKEYTVVKKTIIYENGTTSTEMKRK